MNHLVDVHRRLISWCIKEYVFFAIPSCRPNCNPTNHVRVLIDLGLMMKKTMRRITDILKEIILTDLLDLLVGVTGARKGPIKATGEGGSFTRRIIKAVYQRLSQR